MASPRHPVLLILLLGFFLLMAKSDASIFQPHRVWVIITNKIGPGIDLTLHCKSKDDDLGQQILANDVSWQFTFRPNLWKTTLFFCSFIWNSELHYFDIFVSGRDYKEDQTHFHIMWQILPNGPCRFNYDNQLFDNCFPWNKN
ncbi:hypothetical protein SLEP1_g43603 [Rubroshorea leprosula]|uniref:S-protein homolog n=1 Tax=Rubroshorea leprosula TaxID=152421 RepID=A0AAV5LEH9_9ROSI|nr:hypothetical protein SLEP1_g43603 [Rubroshorea leprosula]